MNGPRVKKREKVGKGYWSRVKGGGHEELKEKKTAMGGWDSGVVPMIYFFSSFSLIVSFFKKII